MKIALLYLLLLMICLSVVPTFGQGSALVQGKVTDENSMPLELVNVAIVGTSIGATTTAAGFYQLRIPADTTLIIDFSFVGYERQQFQINLPGGAVRELEVILRFTSTDLEQVEIKDQQVRYTNYIRLDPKEAKLVPSIIGNYPLTY